MARPAPLNRTVPMSVRQGETRGAGGGSQTRVEYQHPRGGSSQGYSPEYRRDALTVAASGNQHLLTCSSTSLWRWQSHGIARRKKTGNAAPTVLRGEHEFLLQLYRKIYPKATADEVRAFICQQSSDHALYSRQAVGKREDELGLTRKRSATTAFQALTPENIRRQRLFWTMPYPLGRLGLARAQLNDTDELGIWIEKANRSYGKSPRGLSCREPGKYGHGEKWSVILSVMPDGRRWVRMNKVAGTTAVEYNAFINDVINGANGIGVVGPGVPQITFLHDNLTAHHSALVTNTIRRAGHQVLPRPAYRPTDGPIEFVINTLEQELTNRIYHIMDDNDLYRELHSVVAGMRGFDAYFAHCGY